MKLLRDEPEGETVALILERAAQRDQPVHMTEVNYAEVQYMIRRKDGDDIWTAIATELRAAPIEFHPANRRLADVAAYFKARHPISLADAFAAALARERNTELVKAIRNSSHSKTKSKSTGFQNDTMNAAVTEFPQFAPDIYRRIALNDLVIYTLYFLSQSGKEIVFEDVVATCFKLFPDRFHLRGYADWPDSTVVNKRWLDCRGKGLLQGSTAAGFSLTAKGLELAERIAAVPTGERRLFGKPEIEKVGSEMRTRAGRFVRSLESSEAFESSSEDRSATNVSEFDFRNMLLCTMETSATTLRNNLEQFRQYASLYQRKDLLEFLEHCKNKYANLLSNASGAESKYRGGMNRQKIK